MLDAFHHSILLMQDAGNGIGLVGIRESGVLSNFHMQPVYLLPWPLLFATSFKPDEISSMAQNYITLVLSNLIKNIRSTPLKNDITLKGDQVCPVKYDNKEHQVWVLHEPSGLPGKRGALPSQVRGSRVPQPTCWVFQVRRGSFLSERELIALLCNISLVFGWCWFHLVGRLTRWEGHRPLPSYGSSKLHYSFQSSLLAAVAAAALCLIAPTPLLQHTRHQHNTIMYTIRYSMT